MENSIAIKEITLVQLPIIKHQLKEVGKEVTKRIKNLDLENQVATIETLQSFKKLRTELNKELKDFEDRRKVIKTEINKPYNELEDVYKPEISEKYKYAIDLLKDKIAFVEDKIKSDKKESIEVYFNELCVSEKIDFITFDKVGISVNLTTIEKKYKEQIYDYISKINDDLALIKTTDFEAEILTEYKRSLNVSNAITSVKTRKENEAKEKARLKAELIQNRKNYLEKLGMHFVEITNAYEFNADIYISTEEIENLSKEDFTAKYSECEVKIKYLKAKELAKQVSEKPTEEVLENQISIKKPIAATVTAPTIAKEPEPLKVASFEVTATMPQLRALGAYMKENNITYKNI
ncbi:DUF1351 domain-containing protein [Polaribacter phage Danklef_1]|uniref:DUF1351 domain-containing protein n=1 Tax=Polaribacter phage Danklef_1 TaxID=2745646 RepID=A0A8E4ZFE1_9CAUD|nr:DUF1351 domain-containing protein [Polaribacter phage Danklef_1]QQV90587.1 DUF1351 domain-containing protein [Polaribacter phage Danklef_2]QQV90664.1 DUF1351 domain-containing protein [Polaribacter phage Danklef_3]QQV90740.1 DUF1351 domain-containing protein [Polaribacter phage Danklef_4]QQV90818.1 DUF1351 domain-containing protein [Polaribacter phage Danklef_5]QQV90509.1 DUF1351 domain-containing protein [Polaribacter phage Danklef_1]